MAELLPQHLRRAWMLAHPSSAQRPAYPGRRTIGALACLRRDVIMGAWFAEPGGAQE